MLCASTASLTICMLSYDPKHSNFAFLRADGLGKSQDYVLRSSSTSNFPEHASSIYVSTLPLP